MTTYNHSCWTQSHPQKQYLRQGTAAREAGSLEGRSSCLGIHTNTVLGRPSDMEASWLLSTTMPRRTLMAFLVLRHTPPWLVPVMQQRPHTAGQRLLVT